MKFLISPGLPRSGTTYTYHNLLAKGNSEFFNAPQSKETNFFSRDYRIENFVAGCNTDFQDRYFIDYSPSYLLKGNSFVDNVLKLGGKADVKFVIHLRNPIDQMFAHYLHDIKGHISKRQKTDSVDYSFFSRKSLKKYSPIRFEKIKAIVDRFGKENVLTVNFHQELSDPEALSQRLGSFLGIDLQPFSSSVVSPGGWMPYYIYGGVEGREVVIGDQIKKVPQESLLLVNGKNSVLWEGVEPELASHVIEGSSTWTKELSQSQIKILYSAVKDDWERVLSLLGQSAEDYPCADTLSAKSAPLTLETANLLDDSNEKLTNKIFRSF